MYEISKVNKKQADFEDRNAEFVMSKCIEAGVDPRMYGYDKFQMKYDLMIVENSSGSIGRRFQHRLKVLKN